MTLIQEHSVTLSLDLPQGDVHAQMAVFYNPVMSSNRNLSILLLNSIPGKKLKIADPFAGSGIRSLRFLKELKKGKIKQLCVNDFKDNFTSQFREGAKRNNLDVAALLKKDLVHVSQDDASLFLLKETGFDYIDIDPFGSPNPFLAAAMARISRGGILAVTATDTAALTGTYPHATRRKYWAESQRNYLMHEIGLRILIRRIQLQGVQFDKALTPLLAYHRDHYFRVYCQMEKGKEKCDEILKQHNYFLWCPHCLRSTVSVFNSADCECGKKMQFAGPLWCGELAEQSLLQKMLKNNPFPEEAKFLTLLLGETAFPSCGFYDLHAVARKYKLTIPPFEKVLSSLQAVRTHFSPHGIKTKHSFADVLTLMKTWK